MAVTNSQTHLRTRLAGLKGLLFLIAGLIVYFSINNKVLGGIFLAFGAILFVVGIAGELKAVSEAAGSRRAMGGNVVFQVILALVLLAGINAFSFFNYQRFDWTQERIFSIPPKVRQQLAQLRGDTDIVVYVRHAAFGQVVDNKQDYYDAAAERKIVEKVRDLAEQFQELGPRFHVEVLDLHDKSFKNKLKEIREKKPELADAIDKAPENSIFFYSKGNVQQLAFHDVYQLDRQASIKANHDQGNLVLNYQGIEPFANKIFNVEQRKPKVAVAVIHPLLSLNGSTAIDFYTMQGAQKTLESHGFDTLDIILKKGFEVRNPEPTVFTYDENQFETLERTKTRLEKQVKVLREDVAELNVKKEEFEKSTPEELNEKYIYLATNVGFQIYPKKVYDDLRKSGRKIETSHVDAKDRLREIRNFTEQATRFADFLARFETDLQKTNEKMSGLKVENLEEQRRIQDLRAKMTRHLADCDLLILPRLSLRDLTVDEGNIPYSIHKLDDAQFGAVKDFMKSGKPVLFCLGPANEQARPFDPGANLPDQVDLALEDLGFKLPKQTILFFTETKAFAQAATNDAFGSAATSEDVPPVAFEWKQKLGSSKKEPSAKSSNNPIRESLDLTSKSFAANKELDLRLRYNRPVYVMKRVTKGDDGQDVVDESAVLMVSDPDSWNEDNPFPSPQNNEPPRYDPNKPPSNPGTILETRTGPFPIAAAQEVTLPPSWGGDGKTVRVAVVGNGSAFVGKNLTPIQQKLLLDLSNWLIGRDDLLAKKVETWEYPRVQLSAAAYNGWQWATRLGLPLLFVYLGLVVAMFRRMR